MDEDESRGFIALNGIPLPEIYRVLHIRIQWNLKDIMHSKSKEESLGWECESASKTRNSNHKNK